MGSGRGRKRRDAEGGSADPASRLARRMGLRGRLAGIAACYFRGSTARRAAEELGLRETTVRSYWLEVYVRCEVSNQREFLAKAIRTAVGVPPGGRSPGPRLASALVLAGRPADVVRHYVQGRTDREAAERLGISPSAVKGYWTSVYLAVGVRDRNAFRAKLIETAMALRPDR